jgi:hypothetical protein
MKASTHVYASTALAAALYAFSHSFWEAAICFVSGTLIDLDHLMDYHLFSGERFSFKDFFSWYYENRWQKIILIFHSYELFGLMCIAANYLDSEVLRGVLWGSGLHLMLDQIDNKRKFQLSPWFYFLGYRIAVGFRREKLELSPFGTTAK